MTLSFKMPVRVSLVVVGVFLIAPHAFAADQLVGYWKFDEGSGTTAIDSSGNGHDGLISNATYSNTVPNTSFADLHSLSFNGTSSIVTTNLQLNNYSQFTIAGWAKPMSASPRAGWFGQNDVFEFGFADTKSLVCYTASGEVNWTFPDGFLGTWHNITCIGDGQHVILYIDGTDVASTTQSTGNYGSSGNTFSIGAGVLDGGTQGPFDGLIDDVRVYNYALTPAQMAALGTGASGPTNNPSIDTFLPADNATGVGLNANLVATFSTTTIATSTGSINIRKVSDNSLIESIPVGSSQVTKNGAAITIDPNTTFTENTQYYVSIPGTAFEDASSKFYEGTASSTWNFTTEDLTAPTPVSVRSSVATTTASISWTTGKEASTKVAYGLTAAYGTSTSESDTAPRVTSHAADLTDLLACTQYHYAAVSSDGTLTATSTDSSFITSGCPGDSVPSSATSTSITVSGAATSTLSDTGHTLTVSTPANVTATSSSIVIQIKAQNADSVLDSLSVPGTLLSAASVVFDVKALIDNTTLLDSFDHPVTISYTYTNGDIEGLDESSLSMYHYHNGAWEQLDDCVVNTAANTITCTTPNFSIFAIFGSHVSSASSADSSSHKSGGSIQSQVANLLAMGKIAEASVIKAQWPNLFPQTAMQTTAQPGKTCVLYPFTRTLRFGMKGEDVRALQKLMNCLGFTLTATGPGAPGEETSLFADRTDSAVRRFQEAYAQDILVPLNLKTGTGIFAELSRGKAMAIMEEVEKGGSDPNLAN